MFMSTPARALFAPPIDPDAAAWRHAVIAAGGSVSAPQTRRISALIHALKACGAWALTDDYAVYATENQTQALVTLKKRQTQTLAHVISTNPTFVTNRGFLGNRDGYIDLGWNPGAGSPLYSQNNARFGCWVYSAAVTNATYVMGNDGTINSVLSLRSNGISGGVNSSSTFSYTGASGFTTGLHTAERTSSTLQTGYVNGASVATNASAISATVPSANFYALAYNDPEGGNTDAGVANAFFGQALASASVIAGEYAAWRAYMTSVGMP